MRRREVPEAILNLVEMLDQQVAPSRRIAQQSDDVSASFRINLTTFGRAADTRTLS
jgi:hypothetical protein